MENILFLLINIFTFSPHGSGAYLPDEIVIACRMNDLVIYMKEFMIEIDMKKPLRLLLHVDSVDKVSRSDTIPGASPKQKT